MSTDFHEGDAVLVEADSGSWGRAFIHGNTAVLTGEPQWQDYLSPPAGFVVALDDPAMTVTLWEDEPDEATVTPITRREAP